jgi:N-acetylmuramoyl-L-alanine amidase
LKNYRIGGAQYVAVSDVARYYGLGNDTSSALKRAVYATGSIRLALEADQRSAEINGVNHWLTSPVLSARGRLWIRPTDVLKTIDPVLASGRTRGNKPVRTIVLDPGHGGGDRGTRGSRGRNEKEFTLDLARRVARRLEAGGVAVKFTRTSDRTVSLEDRVQRCSNHGGDLFVSLHFNSGGSASGIETYCVPPAGAASTAAARWHGAAVERSAGNRYDAQNVWLAHCVQQSLVRTTGAEDRGVRRARFYVLRYATCPAILIEAGFLSNRVEEQKILSADYRDLLAKAIAEGILKYRRTAE